MTLNKLLIGVAAILFLGLMSIFTVSETEKAIKFKLGEIVKDDYESGIHFKWPIVNNVKKFDSRIQTMDTTPERFLTAEKKNVIVDSFVKWRIGNVKAFYTVVGGDINQANLRLDQIIKDAFRSEFGKRDITQLVATDRKIIREILIDKTREIAADLGLDIIDVQVKRIDLPSDVSSSVFRRMEAERERVAREFRSQGSEAAERIRSDADRQRVVILAEAFREAEKLRGEGDAIAADTYAKAFTRDSEFYSFYRSINAYKDTFSDTDRLMVIDPESEFFKYFKSQK
ncbi:MAG: protease modulator HflC [Gammaproteobacteria bacterium]|nr:protease modulator HflC [Gammaproteobacteria bacterium]